MEQETFTLVFTKAELVVLNKALIELPFKEAAPLIEVINNQISKQVESLTPKLS